MNVTIRDAVIATVSYADAFDYPLTLPELQRWLIIKSTGSKVSIPKSIIKTRDNGETYVHLNGRKSIVPIRVNRNYFATEKWKRAQKLAGLLILIPSVSLVGVSGALAMNNTHQNDDIDIVIVVHNDLLWMTRFLVVVISELLRIRRRPEEKSIKNKFCFNMFLPESHLGVAKEEQDLYSAHEVLQMVPLCFRENMYKKFLNANSWVKIYLPNAWKQISRVAPRGNPEYLTANMMREFFCWVLSFLEPILKYVQLWYMKKRRTYEIISETVLRFHPKDARIWVKQKLGKRLEQFRIPLDKIFYAS